MTLSNRVLYRFNEQNWPPRFWLNTLRYLFMALFEVKGFGNKPTTIRVLQVEIKRCVNKAFSHIYSKWIKGFLSLIVFTRLTFVVSMLSVLIRCTKYIFWDSKEFIYHFYHSWDTFTSVTITCLNLISEGILIIYRTTHRQKNTEHIIKCMIYCNFVPVGCLIPFTNVSTEVFIIRIHFANRLFPFPRLKKSRKVNVSLISAI